MKYAVIRTGGKQYRVAEGDVIEVERLSTPEGENITFTDVLLVTDEDKTVIGSPLVSNFPVVGEVVAHIRGDKIRVSKYKAKVRHRRVTGHRQALSTVKISVIGKEAAKKVEKPVVVQKETGPLDATMAKPAVSKAPKNPATGSGQKKVESKAPAKKAAPKKKE